MVKRGGAAPVLGIAVFFCLLCVVRAALAGAPEGDSCSNVVAENASPEAKASMLIGGSAVYEGNPDLGVSRTVRCLLESLRPPGDYTLKLSPRLIGQVLLWSLIADPKTWLEAAAQVPDTAIERWLGRPLLSTQLRPVGTCPQVDKFDLARLAIGRTKASGEREERVKDMVSRGLADLHCRVPY